MCSGDTRTQTSIAGHCCSLRRYLNLITIVPSPHAGVAQSVEQWTENPRVGGSIPPPGILTLIPPGPT